MLEEPIHCYNKIKILFILVPPIYVNQSRGICHGIRWDVVVFLMLPFHNSVGGDVVTPMKTLLGLALDEELKAMKFIWKL